MNRGHFIVVEGLEGAGKSTAIQTIQTFLKEQTIDVVLTREPGGTQVGEITRDIRKGHSINEPLTPQAELLLFYAARVQLLEQVVRPALKRGYWVLADRFELSTLAYQGGGRHLDISMIQQLSVFCVQDTQPDLTIFLDIEPLQGLQRAKARGTLDRIEQESLTFFNTVYDAYHHHIKNRENVVIINAALPLDQVQHQICQALELFIQDQYVNV